MAHEEHIQNIREVHEEVLVYACEDLNSGLVAPVKTLFYNKRT
jgi:hypothetical protein